MQKCLAASSIVVVIPELVEGKWYEYFLHSQRGRLLEWVLHARGNERIFTVSAPGTLGNEPNSARGLLLWLTTALRDSNEDVV